MWKRQAAFAALIVLVAALAAMIVPTSDAGPQRTSAALLSAEPLEAKAVPAAATPGAAEHSPTAAQTTPAPCANGTVVAQPDAQPDLVADCTALLEARDALRGTAELNWSAERRLTSWTGVRVERVSGVQRVTALNLFSRGLNGVIPAALGELTGLQELDLALNRLTGPIPPELGRLTRLTRLTLSGNHLSGPIPGELGAIGPSLESLQLRGPQPLPEGVGLTGVIPAQLGNLTGLRSLVLPGHRLTGSIPPRLGRLANLTELYLSRNQLEGAIPTQLGALTNLNTLRLEDNRLSGVIPSQLGDLPRLRRIDLKRNAGFSGCVPAALSEVRVNDINQLDLPDCAADAPQTPATPEPSYTLTVTSEGGGDVSPSGSTTHAEASLVTLTASWTDATHTFAGWGGSCDGSATACMLEMYADHSVTATFTPLPAERCAAPTGLDCIRAVYRGAPEDYAQVQDIPTERLLSPDAEGRYEVERGRQYTVVTAAPLPAGYSRFYLERRPTGLPAPLSHEQLVPPVGTTYTFTVSEDEHAPTLITFELIAARPPLRPGLKPQLGDVIVTTEFQVKLPPLALELSSSRELCTANTLTELSWGISGGQPPYTLSIDGEAVDAESESYRVNCGPIPTDPMGAVPGTAPSKVFSATVTDSRTIPVSVADEVRVALAEALPSVADVEPFAARSYVGMRWPNHTRQNVDDNEAWYLFRSRPQGESEWRYERVSRARDNSQSIHAYVEPHQEPPAQPIVQQLQVARTRLDIEAETPDALNWSPTLTVTSLIPASGIRLTATHDSVTVRWDPQASNEVLYVVSVGTRDRKPYSGASKHVWLQPDSKHEVTFSNLLPSTEYHASITVRAGIETMKTTGPMIRTAAAPDDYEPFPIGPQNLRVTNVTNTSISVRWDRPFPGASESYAVNLFRADWPSNPVLHVSGHGQYQARFNNLEPGTDYVVWVTHYGTVKETARLPVSTLPSAGASTEEQRQPRAGGAPDPVPFPGFEAVEPPRISWPLHFGELHIMTEDIWTWRGYGFHGGLDIGIAGGSDLFRTRSEPVIAAADGLVRFFGYSGEGTRYIVYCPERDGPFHSRFIVHDWEEVSEGGGGDKVYECRQVVAPDSGNVALVFHGDPAHGPYFTKYGHMDHFDLAPAARLRALALSNGETAYTVRRGERLGYVGNTGRGIEYQHAHFELRQMPPNRFDLAKWHSDEPDYVDCEGNVATHNYCVWTPDRRLPSFLDPEAHLPPRPAGDSHVVAIAPFSFLSATPTATGVTATLTVRAWRPPFYALDPGLGLGYRDQLTGIEFTRAGVDAYGVVARCRDASFQEAPLRPLRRLAGEGPSSVPVPIVANQACDVSTATRNFAYPLADPPVWSFGRATSGPTAVNPGAEITVGSAYADPPGPPEAHVRAFELSGDAQTISASLSGYSYHFFRFIAVRGKTYRFCVDLTELTESGDCDDIGNLQPPMKDVVVEVWGADGLVTNDDGTEVRDDRNGEADLSWTANASGSHTLLLRGGLAHCGLSPCEGAYVLRYTVTCPEEGSAGSEGSSSTSRSSTSDGSRARSSIDQCFALRLASPQSLLLTSVTDMTATLTWASGDDDTAGYELQLDGKSLDPQPELGSATSHTFERLNTATKAHVFGVIATGDFVLPSEPATLTLLLPPTGLTTTATEDSVTLTWNALPDLSYQVKRGDGSEGPADSSTPHTFEGLESNTPYTLHVRARNSQGPSYWATETETTALAALELSAWASPTSCETGGTVTIHWSVSGGSDSYTVSVGGVAKSGNSTSFTCRSTAGTQTVNVVATDTVDTSLTDTAVVRLTVTASSPQVCPSPRPTQPSPQQGDPITISTAYKWVERGTTAYKQVTKELRPRTKPYEWQAYPECAWELATDWVLGAVYTVGPTDTGETQEKPPTKEPESAGTQNTWVVGATEACEYLEVLERSRMRTVTFSMDSGYVTGSWGEWSDPYVISSTPTGVCPAKPADNTRTQKSASGGPYWTVTGLSACEYQNYELQAQKNSAVWSGSAWVFRASGWTDVGAPTTSSERTTRECIIGELDSFSDREVVRSTWTAWEQEGDGLVICWLQQYRYERYVIETWLTTYSWGGTSWVPQTSLFLTSDVQTRKTAIGSPMPISCTGARSSTAPAGTQFLIAGDYIFTWGDASVSFTVPADARVDLSWRVLESGVRAAVLTDEGAGEVLVHPGAAAARDARDSDPDKRSAALQSLEGSIAHADPAAAQTAQPQPTPCAVVSADSPPASIDLDTNRCASVAAGGQVRITVAGHALSLTLTSDRYWVVARLRTDATNGSEPVALFDVATTSSLLLDPATGAELERNIADDAPTEIGALFDAIASSVQRSDAAEDGS